MRRANGDVERKGVGKLLRAIHKTYKDFTDTTSIHGIKYISHDEITFSEKILWLVIVTFGIIGSSFMVILFWQRYLSNPTRTSTLTNTAPNIALPVPAVTLCTINRLSQKKMDAFIKKLEMEPEDREDVKNAMPQLMGFTHPSMREFNSKELAVLEKVLKNNDFSRVTKIMAKISTTCEEMLLKCSYRGRVLNCMEIFVETLTTDGLCCSFNYRSVGGVTMRNYSRFFGPDLGLSIIIDPRLEDQRYSVFRSTGIKMIFHKSTDYPGIGATHKFVAAGKASYLQISGTRIICSNEVRMLSFEQRECIFPEDIQLRYFSDYTNPNCFTECTAIQLMDYCECTPYFYWFAERDRPICGISKIPCLAEFSRVHYKNQSNCSCFSQCEEVFYDILTTSGKTNFGSHITSSFLNGINDTVDKILLTIFFSSDVQTIFKRDTITSAIYLLSSFGGVFSLFLGCSFLSCFEIVYHVTLRLWINYRMIDKKKIRERTKNLTPEVNFIRVQSEDMRKRREILNMYNDRMYFE